MITVKYLKALKYGPCLAVIINIITFIDLRLSAAVPGFVRRVRSRLNILFLDFKYIYNTKKGD